MYCSKIKMIVFGFCSFAMAACVTRKDTSSDLRTSTRLPSSAEVFAPWGASDKLAAKDIQGDLRFQQISVGGSKGLLLAAEVGANADYIAYDACPSKAAKGTSCISGKTASLAEVVFTIPPGDYELTYQACVQEGRAQAATCGPKKNNFFTLPASTADRSNELLRELTQTSQEIKAQALAFRSALAAHKKAMPPQANNTPMDNLVDNQLKMSPYKLAALYDSEFFDATKQIADNNAKAGQDEDKQTPGLQLGNNDILITGTSLMAFGSVGVAAGLWGLYAHKHFTLKNRGMNKAEGFFQRVDDGLSNLFSFGKPPTARMQDERALRELELQGKGMYYNFMGSTKTFASQNTYKAIAIVGAIAMVTAVIVSAITSQKLADDGSAPTALLSKAATIEAHIQKLKERQAAIIEELAAIEAAAD